MEARWLLEEAGLRTTPVPLWAQASTRVSLIRRLEAMESLIVRLKCTYKLAHFQLCLRLDFSSQTDLPPRPQTDKPKKSPLDALQNLLEPHVALLMRALPPLPGSPLGCFQTSSFFFATSTDLQTCSAFRRQLARSYHMSFQQPIRDIVANR